jgi:fructokinase
VNRIGVDLGGTKIEVVALRPDNTEIYRHRVPTPAGDYHGIIAAIANLVRGAEAVASPTFPEVGIGTPGAVSPVTGLMKNANSTVLIGRPFDVDLEAALGRPLVMRNDADCFALSEARDGAGAEDRVVFGVIIGTGVGGGVVVDGRLQGGPNAVTGEWGHNSLPWPGDDELPGPRCYCGKQGCIETFLSGTGLENLYRTTTGSTLEAPEIVDRYRQGEAAATHHLQRYFDRMARSLATVINLLDPDVIVLGGGMSNVAELGTEVPARWAEYVFGGEVTTRLAPNVHGDSSGVRGAAFLVGGG